ncbi:hypothetical protein KAW43_02640 [Candidatus Parcubacteria bacterium]|nr:hypothetical protein [Candidatus Parcubacteria bacterium]
MRKVFFVEMRLERSENCFTLIKKMRIKKNILTSILVLSLMGLFLGLPLMILGAAPEELPDVDLIKTLENIADWLFYILLGVAVVFIVIGGIYYVTAQGDPEKVKKAGQSIQYALIGVIVAAVSKGLVTLIQKFPMN